MSTANTAAANVSPVGHPGSLTLARLLGLGAAVAAAALLTVSLIGGSAEGYAVAGCRVAPSLPHIGVETQATMQVSRGASCAIWLPYSSIAVDGMAITQPPTNGLLRMRGRTGVYYQPSKAFTGDDAFAFEVVGQVGALRKTTTVRVRVNVR